MGLDIKADPKVFGDGDHTGIKVGQAIQTALLKVSNKFRDTLAQETTTAELAKERIPEKKEEKK